ncbi:3-ketoacyl-CoA thiolase, mitochondrial-like [Eurytemora carolleeae]|uniref:3-ketoacyl-CoA thiolase, mitochondrial-like n=1 Tax=Eurytemora carolleeae TaxID=1294199 RepID=UPI000C791879|nr:3-ketoacyl-CoA thiolase, mitochondrial-like [Eurytemora carolleeae]|eukprot:XP_023343731.1 3-ketoacyl-CoA thiolase, mitochondrial-like [Eurytemora affinis]
MATGNSLARGVYVVAAKRTAFGAFGGTLKGHSPTDLQVHAAQAAMAAGGVKAENISSVCIGNVLSASSADAPYLARHVALRCGLAVPTPALIVNRLCGSGFQSVVNGVQEILVGDSEIVLTGGTDNMSACPYAVRDIRFGTKLGQDPKLEDMMWTSLTDMLAKTPMGVTAENLAEKYNITREECDNFALRSQQTWAAAAQAGVFADEIAALKIKTRKGEVVFDTDEHPKPKTTLEQLVKLPTVFKKNGVVTAASASGICDGAAAVIIASEEAVAKYNLTPLARIAGYGVAGCDPTIMGIGPVPAIGVMLEKAGLTLGQIDQIEINEAFGAQTLACQKALDIPMEKLNTCGGAIALGHPLAASGARISAHLVHKLRQNKQKYGIGSACIGGGQGISILFEAV